MSSSSAGSGASQEAAASCSNSWASCPCLPRNAICRRRRSIALLRPTLTSHARGLDGGSAAGERCVEILGFDQVIAAELLARLREWTIRGQGLAVADPHGGRSRCRLQPVAGLEIAALDNGLGECTIFVRHLLARGRVHFGVFGFVGVDHQQILHLFAPFARQVLPTSSRTGQSQNDILRIIYFDGRSWRYLLDATGLSPHHKGVSRPDACSSDHRKVAGEESPGSIDIRCRITSGGGNPRDSATEIEPLPPPYPPSLAGEG